MLLLLRNSIHSLLSVEITGSGILSPQNLPRRQERDDQDLLADWQHTYWWQAPVVLGSKDNLWLKEQWLCKTPFHSHHAYFWKTLSFFPINSNPLQLLNTDFLQLAGESRNHRRSFCYPGKFKGVLVLITWLGKWTDKGGEPFPVLEIGHWECPFHLLNVGNSFSYLHPRPNCPSQSEGRMWLRWLCGIPKEPSNTAYPVTGAKSPLSHPLVLFL